MGTFLRIGFSERTKNHGFLVVKLDSCNQLVSGGQIQRLKVFENESWQWRTGDHNSAALAASESFGALLADQDPAGRPQRIAGL
jgi:hypothetical protein